MSDLATELELCNPYPHYQECVKRNLAVSVNMYLVEQAAARIRQLEAERDAAYRRGLEDAAKVADDHAQTWGPAMSSPAIAIANAIRALAK